ncbi:MAG: hypothetical protein ACTTJC_02120 [Campylobacter sp.]
MLSQEMILRDLGKILAKTNAVALAKREKFNVHLNKYTKIIFDDGITAIQTTALALASECKNLRVKDEININDEFYQITKIELENQYLKRLYLKGI